MPFMNAKSAASSREYTFDISLSVLNHLGRHLYRSFVTILGEAISNAWDADAKNVWIYVDKAKNTFTIKDDGIGMSGDDFQGKFLNIGYSKRKDLGSTSSGGRPFIGRKGIGKLALLSCAARISILSKTKDGAYIGGTIDNSGLDEAIKDNLKPGQYPLDVLNQELFAPFIKDGDEHGTIIHFEGVTGGIRNTLDLLKKVIALYFRFSLIDDSFNIFIEEEKITYENLKDLADKTEFLWNVNGLEDPYVQKLLPPLKEQKDIKLQAKIQGFVASVTHYRDLNIMNLDEKVGIDLFVNGRLRERDILKRISKARVVESYLYGQIHFNDLDDNSETDRFTSNREGVVADDEKYQQFLKTLDEDVLKTVISDWDKWRIKHREDGDPENPNLSPKDRKAGELFNVVSDEYSLPGNSANKKKVEQWVNALAEDATFNFGSYAECFIAENLVRKLIQDKGIPLSTAASTEINVWKPREVQRKAEGNVSIELRQNQDDLSYVDMSFLADMVDRPSQTNPTNNLVTDGKTFRPIRNAVMHTALLTAEAKQRLTTVFNNMKARVITLLS